MDGEGKITARITPGLHCLDIISILILLFELNIYERKVLVPKFWSSIHQVKDLSWVEKLPELAKELHPLVVATFRVDKDQKRTAARGRGGLPEA